MYVREYETKIGDALQPQLSNQMYITASPGLGQPTFTAAEQSTVQGLIGQAIRNENALSNRVFADRHPQLKGKALTSGTASSREWVAIRDGLVRPALAAVPKTIIPSRPCCILAPEIPVGGPTLRTPPASEPTVTRPRSTGSSTPAAPASSIWGTHARSVT